MKIGIIHSIFKPEFRGGAEVAVENIASGLKERGEDVFVVCVGRENKIDTIDSIKIYRIKPSNLFNFLDINKKSAWLRLPWHIIDMFNDIQTWRVYKILMQEKPDLVLTHNLKGLGYYLPWLLRLMKIRNIYTVHDMQLLHPSGLLPEGDTSTCRLQSPLVAIYRWFCKKLFGSPAVVIFPSEYIKGVYGRFGFFRKSKKAVLGNPIKILNSKSEILNKFKIQSASWRTKFRILFLGQVEAYKGIFELIEAVKGIKGDLVLHIVGDGKALIEAKNRAQGHIADGFSGAQNGPKIKFWERLSQSEMETKIWPITDILVNPSQTAESFGMVVIEAYAHGVPVLVSDKGALPELVREGETGFIVENNNWREKIQWCLAHQNELTNMRENCLKEAEKYRIENYLNKLMEFDKMEW